MLISHPQYLTPARSSTYVASQVFLLAKDDVVYIELGLEFFEVLFGLVFIRLSTKK